MRLTPLEVVQQTFSTRLRGLDAAEVQAFLKQVGETMEELLRDSARLKDAVAQLEAEVADYKSREVSLRDSLVSAQRLREDIERQARKEAEQIRAEAELQAERMITSANSRAGDIEDEVRELKMQRARFEAEVKGIIGAHLALLKARREADRTRVGVEAAAPPVPAPGAEKLRVIKSSAPEDDDDTGASRTAEG
jgi:cell division initiation protein